MTWDGWTDENFEKAKRLRADGLSAAQITKAIGAPSRNATIGKFHRAGIFTPRAPSAPKNTEPKAEARRGNPYPIPAPIIHPEPPPGGITIMELRWPTSSKKATCRWPIGGGGVDMKYCGCEAVEIYCRKHRKMAYQPMSEAVKKSGIRGAMWAAKQG